MTPRFRRVWLQLTADKRRFGVLCAAITVGLLLWARFLIVSRMPRTAVADDVAPANALTGDAEEAAASRSRTRQRVELDTTPARDPFVISPLHFPKPTVIQETDQDAQKSMVQPTEEPGQVEARRTTRLTELASGLTLDAALGSSLAVISGSRIRPGQTIEVKDAGQTIVFTLETINQRSVILECEGRRFELQMAAPGN